MTTTTEQITNDQDLIDVRDVIARVKELESDQPSINEMGECDDCGVFLKRGDETHNPECAVLELQRLTALLEDLEGNGGDEEWRGSWYPVTLIRESYFKDYAEQLAEDIGAVNAEASWPNSHIDWEAASNELLTDYGSTEFDGVTYYYR